MHARRREGWIEVEYDGADDLVDELRLGAETAAERDESRKQEHALVAKRLEEVTKSHSMNLKAAKADIARVTRDEIAKLDKVNEERARDLYWAVVQNRTELSDAQAGAMLTEAAALNPHIGEVDALAAQLHFRNQRFRKAKRLAASALRKLYAMGATWD